MIGRRPVDEMQTPDELSLTAEDPIGQTAQHLIRALCAEMESRYGKAPSPFSLSDAASARSIFLVARIGGAAVGCGALRFLDEQTAEIKRMYVVPQARRRNLGRHILRTLEQYARDFEYRAIHLETGIRQPEAQALYESLGYKRIAAFGKYVNDPTSVCFEKLLGA